MAVARGGGAGGGGRPPPLAGFFQKIYKGGSKVKNESEDLTKKRVEFESIQKCFYEFSARIKGKPESCDGCFFQISRSYYRYTYALVFFTGFLATI